MQASENTPILIVDDRSENLVALEAILSEPGVSLIRANSGNEALRKVLQQDFALILLDVQMPDMDGFETAEFLRLNPKTRHIPIIFVTAGIWDQKQQFKGYEQGAVDYIIKPFEPMVLKSKVHIFCELHRQRKELQVYNQNLELLVKKRTVSLEANKALLLEVGRIANVGGFEIKLPTGELTLGEQVFQIFELDSARPTSLDDIFSRCLPDSRTWLESAIHQAREKGTPFDLELQIEAGGHLRWVNLIGQATLASDKINRIVGVCQDITLMKEQKEKLEHIAHYDMLTGLPNRVLFADRLQQAIAQSQRRKLSLAVAYLDLDGFKEINDSYGHGVGDELLRLLSENMKNALRVGDTLARIGGDEFVAVITNLDSEQDCTLVLERLLHAASMPITVGEAVLTVSTSIGVSLCPQDSADADLLLRNADQAMYEAKQEGKNRYHLFDLERDTAIKNLRENLDSIRNAIKKEEFRLYYQPKVNMRSREIIGAEALIRWQHPQRGLVFPGDFLPFIENHVLSHDVGSWVLKTALTQISAWQAAGMTMPVSVNVSAIQLQQTNFVDQLDDLLKAHPDVNPNLLELEIVETSALENVSKVSQVMHACLSLGVGFALDDFGTGYSSLSYLKHFPAELLKIDQVFIRNMLENPDDLTIVEAIIGLADAFHRKVIAEGVETEEIGKHLLKMGCDLAQGYSIARPMPADKLPEWVESWKAQQ